jgi:hypothetical protein
MHCESPELDVRPDNNAAGAVLSGVPSEGHHSSLLPRSFSASLSDCAAVSDPRRLRSCTRAAPAAPLCPGSSVGSFFCPSSPLLPPVGTSASIGVA